MDMCDVCNNRHEKYQAHIFNKPVKTSPVVNELVNHQKPLEVVVNADKATVVNKSRTKDRHRKTEARKLYMRNKMREYRAKGKV